MYTLCPHHLGNPITLTHPTTLLTTLIHSKMNATTDPTYIPTELLTVPSVAFLIIIYNTEINAIGFKYYKKGYKIWWNNTIAKLKRSTKKYQSCTIMIAYTKHGKNYIK